MSLPGFLNDNAARAYPLVPFSNAILGTSTRPPTTQIRDWETHDLEITEGQWTRITNAGRGGSCWKSLSPSAGVPGSVIWRFDAAPGRQYRISATWPADPGLASNARFVVAETDGHGYFDLITIRLDQRLAPAQRTGYDASWIDLGIVTTARRTLAVTLHDDADAPPIADAIWVEDITPDTAAPIVEIVLPLDTLVDFGCMVGLDAEFDDALHAVYLHEIRRIGDAFEFDFYSNAPGLMGYVLRFRRDLADPEYATDYAEAAPLDGGTAPDDLLWEGFLATGPLGSLAAMMPADGTMSATTGPQVEPALVQNLGRGHIRTINLANQDRTRSRPPTGCQGGDETAGDSYGLVVNARGLVGDLRFKEGYNFSIRQTTRENVLAFSARQGAGAGMPCDEVPLYPGEQPPSGSLLLTGGPACDEIIGSINGLTASVVRMVPGLGTRIVPSPTDPNTLIVDFDRHDMTVCGDVEVVVEDLSDG